MLEAQRKCAEVAMPTFTLQGRVTPDHKLEVQLPPEVPEGEAEVTLSVEDRHLQPLGSPQRFLETLREIHARPNRTYRTKEEIDRSLQEEEVWRLSTRGSSSAVWHTPLRTLDRG